MTDIFETIKSVLERDCAVTAYYEKLPVNIPQTSYIRFQRISTYEYMSHSGRSNLHRDRFQITCVARTHAALVSLIAMMETSLYSNNWDFKLAYPLEGSREIPDGAETYQKDFYIFYE